MTRWLMILLAGALGLAACSPPAPQTQVCTPVTDQGTVTGSLTPVTSLRVLDPDKTEVTPSQVVVTDSSFSANTGDVLVSNCNDGLLRRVTGVSTQFVGGSGVSSQAVRKVYIQTENAALEDAIASGEVNLETSLTIGEATLVQALDGVSVQNFTGRINLTNVRFDIPGVPGASIALNGFIEQTLRPNFNLRFSSGSVELFRAGMSGTLRSQITATVQANASYSPFNVTRELASWNIKRVFLVGSVPVVVVVQPRLIAGVSSAASGKVTVEVGIAPTFTTNVQLDYNRTRPVQERWQNTFTANFAVNPTFNYSVPVQGSGNAFAGLAMDIKFYGLAGPSLEAKPFIALTLNGNNGSAGLETGINGRSRVEAGFRVLGRGLETSYDGPTIKQARSFSCQAPSTCTAN
ncbi:hypothetical protein [uncultured Meiothermus sp.]|jgi:hypothetical protein|uniref:hypothetical protein n=1 Tax=uncultured Meiothermus sp. TaxID=157471 RepID=UPI002614677A|nr:hypothetical protein [uncultured Meiothermus sp.]